MCPSLKGCTPLGCSPGRVSLKWAFLLVEECFLSLSTQLLPKYPVIPVLTLEELKVSSASSLSVLQPIVIVPPPVSVILLKDLRVSECSGQYQPPLFGDCRNGLGSYIDLLLKNSKFLYWRFLLILHFLCIAPKGRNWFLIQLGYSWPTISLNVISIFYLLRCRFLHQETVGSDSCQKMCWMFRVLEGVLDVEGEDSGLCLTLYLPAVEPWASYFISEFVYVSAKWG